MAKSPKPDDASRRARRKRLGRYVMAGVLLLWVGLIVLTTVLLIDEFSGAGGTEHRGAEAASPHQRAPEATAASQAISASGADTVVRARAELAVAPAWLRPDTAAVLTRIAVGACLQQERPQPIWNGVLAVEPELFLMVGDNVYGDITAEDPETLLKAYQTQAVQPELTRARAAIPFLATWDDHDYGLNDAGAGFKHRDYAATLFRSFWQLPEAGNADGGIYYAKTYGPEGRRVQIIMLDARSFRSRLTRKDKDFPYPGHYAPSRDDDQSMLGETQWSWLVEQLKMPAELRLVVSSTQVLAEGHGYERWGNLPRERERLEQLIGSLGVRGVIFLSGDRHAAAIYSTDPVTERAQPRLVELTASSLNLAFGPSQDARLPPLVSDIYYRENFGLIEIDWQNRRVHLSVRAIDGEEALGRDILFAELGLD